MASGTEFSLLHSDVSRSPHYFAAFRHDSDHVPSWGETVESCLKAWRLNAKVFRVENTGFASDGIMRALNERGRERLPSTPPEDEDITKNPYVTDVTEVLALRLLKNTMPGAVFPCPRVLHKERPGLQHHGIDILGYEQTQDGATLLVAEVMASVSGQHPPSTVSQHVDQVLRETLNAKLPERLLDELSYAQAESSDAEQKEVLNGFIAAICDGSRDVTCGQKAVAILVRPVGLWFISDWAPFFQKADQFESARIPATVWFGAIECDCLFSMLLDKIKDTATDGLEEGR